jgi:hypothetical protein
MRSRFLCHCIWLKVRVCTEVRLTRIIVGGLGVPQTLKNLPVGRERDIQQVRSCRSEDALAQKRCEIKAEGRGDGSKKW